MGQFYLTINTSTSFFIHHTLFKRKNTPLEGRILKGNAKTSPLLSNDITIVPGHTTLSSKGKIQYPHYPHIPLQSHTAKPSGTAAQFHSAFRSGNPDNPTSIASHITVSSYTAALSQCHFRSIIQSIPHTLQHQEISTFRSVTHAL